MQLFLDCSTECHIINETWDLNFSLQNHSKSFATHVMRETRGKEGIMTGKIQKIILFALVISAVLNACTAAPPTTIAPVPTNIPTITMTPNPCAPENIHAEVQKVHKFMREFDDASSLAASRPREQLSDAIAELQKIRRDAEDQQTPPCLRDLQTYQISHMNSVINTLIAFMGGSDQQAVDQGIALARQQHDMYTMELARLLGITVVPATVVPVVTATSTP